MANNVLLAAISVLLLQTGMFQPALSEVGESAASRGSKELLYVNSPRDQEVSLRNKRIDLKVVRRGTGAGSIKSLVYKREGMRDVELLETNRKEQARGYWDLHWDSVGSQRSGWDIVSSQKSKNKKFKFGDTDGASWSTLENGEDLLGVTFDQFSGPSRQPVHTKVQYSMRSDLAGAYCTLLVNHTQTDPAILLDELRLVLKLNSELFDYSYVSDDRQRYMPTSTDISRQHSSALDFKEARLIYKSKNKSFVHEVDHKYHFSVETKDATVYGWISTKLNIGVWIISPNKWEYLGGGPNKQDLSVQTGPNLLAMLHSCHYGTPAINLTQAEEWKKAFGPFLIYVNEAEDINGLIADAKARAAEETRSWPYKWVPFSVYPSRDSRGTVTGRVLKQDPFSELDKEAVAVSDTWVGLIDETSAVSNWEDEVKSYQYWNITNKEGEFTIRNVRPGTYVLQTLVRGFLIDSSVLQTVSVEANWVSSMGEIVLRPTQRGPIVWEIGYPDRSAAEFMVPIELRGGKGIKDAFRQYGLWQKFADLYPEKDPVFTVGVSNSSTDWFFAHVVRQDKSTTDREIVFSLDEVIEGDYTLRLAIAGAHEAALEVRLNNPSGSPLHDTGSFGKDNALARAGIHGRYREFSISLSHMNLRRGSNSLFLRQRKNENKFSYVMYDYIRLESPARSSATSGGSSFSL